MVVSLRGQHRSLLLYGGAYFIVLMCGLYMGDRQGWLITLPLTSAIAFYAWIATFLRYRAVGDMPTSTVASAAQGYVELVGEADVHPDLPNLARLSRKPCCWYRYTVEERDDDSQWRTVDSGESISTFLLRDATGSCTIDPEGAEILCTHKESWYPETHQRCTEWRIHPGDPLYALGEFRTRNLQPGPAEARADLKQLLAEWKTEPKRLLRRFDLDGNGELDLREWALARAQARREVARDHAALRATPAFDVLQRPADGRLFLLANQTPAALTRRFVLWSWTHLAIFFAALIGLLRFVAQA